METYKGACHCEAVTFTIESEPITEAVECNCSHCAIKGMLLAFVPKDKFTLDSGADNLIEYPFNKKVIKHQFCQTCGVEPFSYGDDPEAGETVAVNVRCLAGIDTESLKINKFNGKDY